MAYENERAVAVRAVERACRLCIRVQRRLVAESTMAKGDRSPVTVADFGAQAVVSQLLAQHFAHDPMVGEEDASNLRRPERSGQRRQVCEAVAEVLPGLDQDAVLAAIDRGTCPGGSRGRFWTLDPIDGTKGFLRLQQYAVALALIEDGEVVMGVLGCPSLPLSAGASERGCLFVAVRGEGAFMRTLDDPRETRVRVTNIADPSRVRFCESFEKTHSSRSDAARVASLLGIDQPPLRIDSQCKYAVVARGDASIYLRLPTRQPYVERIWDHAAGWAVVTEAGGMVSDMRGEALDFSQGRGLEQNAGVIVTNGHLHARVLEAVQAVG